jgi:Domain of unknown function (DUF6134)
MAGPVADAVAGECPAGARGFDPKSLYGDAIAFDVYRNGDRVGEHTVSFSTEGDALVARTRFTLAIRILYVPVYRFEYEAVDRWRDGCLVAMTADIREDSDAWTVTTERAGDRLIITGPKGAVEAPLGIYPTNHYDVGVLGSDRVLNTITGAVNHVRIVEQGTDMVPVGAGERPARHYAYTGELQNHVWYDNEGRWVAMRFKGKDGSTIELRCRSCGASAAQR